MSSDAKNSNVIPNVQTYGFTEGASSPRENAFMVQQQTAAKQNEINHVLQNCTDFLGLYSHILVAWRLMDSAKIAKAKLDSTSGDERKYLETKIVDFKIYCAHYLTHAIAMAKTITSSLEDITSFDIE